MFVYLLNIPTMKQPDAAASPEELDAALSALPSIVQAAGPFDFILSAKNTHATDIANAVGSALKSSEFVTRLDELEPGADPVKFCKQLNRLIGKERILVLVDAGTWKTFLEFAAREDSPVEPEGPLSLAEVYIKGFPGPKSGVLNWVKSSADLESGKPSADTL